MSKWRRAYVGLGSNLGDRLATLRSAARALADHPALRGLCGSPIYSSPPLGDSAKHEFFNAVVALETTLEPRALLELCLAVEHQHGRVRGVRWGPRTLDLDVLWYAGQTIAEPGLVVPHPGLAEREFVLRPLVDLAPDLELPDGRCAIEALEEIDSHACLPVPGALFDR